MNGRASPTTTAWLIKGWARSRSSNGAGRDVLAGGGDDQLLLASGDPEEAVRRRGRRYRRCRNQPSASNVAAVAASLCQYPRTPAGPWRGSPRRRAMRIVVPASGLPTVPGLQRVGAVDGQRRAGLGEAVALEHLHADAVEEVRQPFAEGAPAAEGEPHAPAEDGLQLAVHQPVERSVLEPVMIADGAPSGGVVLRPATATSRTCRRCVPCPSSSALCCAC